MTLGPGSVRSAVGRSKLLPILDFFLLLATGRPRHRPALHGVQSSWCAV